MKYITIFLFLLMSSDLQASSDVHNAKDKVESIMHSLAKSDNYDELRAFMNSNELADKKVGSIARLIKGYGGIRKIKCFVNHKSKSLFGVICHITYENHKSGNSWSFFLFKGNKGLVGTNLEISKMLGKSTDCLTAISAKIGFLEGLNFEKNDCSN